jgi:hypothetical protein
MKNSDLLSRNSIYSATYQQMMGYLYAYLGGYTFKQYVRKKRPSEDSNLWNDLVQNTVAMPISRYVVDTINNCLFEPGITRIIKFATPDGNFIEPKNCEWSDLFINDVDLNNRSLTSFMEQVADLSGIFGHCWVAVDMPEAADGNLGRPYCCAISPADVWDWEWKYYGGKPILSFVKIKETEDKDYYYIKCYFLGDSTSPSYWHSYRVSKKEQSKVDKDAELLGSGYFPAGMSIPVFISYGRRDPRMIDLGVSDIDAASDAQREVYKLECEAYTALQFARTIIRADKGVNIPVHAGAIVRGIQGCVEALKIDTGDVDQIIKKQEDIISSLEGLTGLGGMRLRENTRRQSGVAIVEERKGLHRIAKQKARLLEITEGLIMTYAARFMNMRWGGIINYNTDYESFDTQYRLALIQSAIQTVGDDPMIKSLVTKELVGMLAPAGDEQEYQQTYVDSLAQGSVKELLNEENIEILNSDVGGIPNIIKTTESDQDKQGVSENDGSSPGSASRANASLLGGPGTPTIPMGPSYYPQQAVAVQITGLNTGR